MTPLSQVLVDGKDDIKTSFSRSYATADTIHVFHLWHLPSVLAHRPSLVQGHL